MLMGSPVGGLMHWPRCLAALFVVLPLAGCASVAAGPRPGAERALSARRTSRHQWNALTGEPDSNPSSEPGRPVPIVTSAPNGVREAPPPAPPGVAVTIEAVHRLFPWLRHLFADRVYNGPYLRRLLGQCLSSDNGKHWSETSLSSTKSTAREVGEDPPDNEHTRCSDADKGGS